MQALESIDLVIPPPEAVAHEGATGVPVTLADGREWLLAEGGVGDDLDAVRDRIFDGIVGKGSVAVEDLRQVALVLLLGNYDLEIQEAIQLIVGVAPKALSRPVCEALFGTDQAAVSYSDWATASLVANGIDPERWPTHIRRLILKILVETGRTVPESDVCDALQVANGRAIWEALARAKPNG